MIAAGQRYETPADWGRPLNNEQRAAQSRAAYRDLLEREQRERVH